MLREEGTERAFTSPLNEEKRKGTYVCAGCALPLFESRTKYDSGTGWPSFWDGIPGRVESMQDSRYAYFVKEYHCARCGGHQGHIFDDGPEADRASLLQQRRRAEIHPGVKRGSAAAGPVMVLIAMLIAGAVAAQGISAPFAHAIRPRGFAEECFKLARRRDDRLCLRVVRGRGFQHPLPSRQRRRVPGAEPTPSSAPMIASPRRPRKSSV